MKPGVRALGLAFSDGPSASTCAGAVVRRDRVVDGLRLSQCAVGGTDATETAVDVWEALGREDVRHVLVAGVAPAWFNLLDLDALRAAAGRPVVAVSFEDSPGLADAIREAFDGEARARRLVRYRSLPPRRAVDAGGTTLHVRAAGVEDDRAAEIVRAHTPDSQGRPEPLRVARLAARAGRTYVDAVAGDDSVAGNDAD
ncbi:MAG: DUF99 family protein [Halolamina sp.]